MIAYLRGRLGAKLFLSYLVIILLGTAILLSTTQFVLPGAFDRHLAGMGPPQLMMGQRGPIGPGQGQGFQGGGPPDMMHQFYDGFRASFNDALTYALLASGLAALAVSLFFSRSVVAPLRAMMRASQRIADGHYDERVTVAGSDELAQLGERFNRMTERLEQTEVMRRRLLGDVSHELRTPLTSIGGYMEGLIDGVLPASPETFEQVRLEALRLSRLVDDLQELSRVEAGAYALELRPLAVAALVGTTIKRLGPQFEEKKIVLHAEITADLPRVLADQDRITQVLTNLLANALAYTPAGGRVTVSAEKSRSGTELQITVRDTGIGIPADALAHIFDRFYRVDPSRSRSLGGGSGIGLTIARYLVEAHGGELWAESPGENQGSSFIFTLPLAK